MTAQTQITDLTTQLCAALGALPLADKVQALNEVRLALHAVSPFAAEPVDCIQWVMSEHVVANEYNPNKVASPEMALLHKSIQADGFTQPIVTFHNDELDVEIVVDGFHRNRVGKEKKDIKARIHGYLPVVAIKKDLHERMASTIRHNRARGKHQVELMSEMVIKLVGLGRSKSEIAKELGLTAEELIRLMQQTGIASLFANQPFSRSWIVIDGDEEAGDTDIEAQILADEARNGD